MTGRAPGRGAPRLVRVVDDAAGAGLDHVERVAHVAGAHDGRAGARVHRPQRRAQLGALRGRQRREERHLRARASGSACAYGMQLWKCARTVSAPASQLSVSTG
jgi:hypothetical protein